MQEFAEELEEFSESIDSKKHSYLRSKADREFVRDAYVKWRQLKNTISLPGLTEDGELAKLNELISEAFHESCTSNPNRELVANHIADFARNFRQHIITLRRIKGLPIDLDWEDPVTHFDTYGLTKEFEENIREFLREKLKREYGDNWIKRGIPKDIRGEWRRRENKDKDEAKKTSDDIEYSSFGDYFEIIKINWNKVFKLIFQDKQKTRVRFNDLKNLARDPTAHAREIDPDEVGHAKFTKRWIEKKISDSKE